MDTGTHSAHLHSVKITPEVKELWNKAIEVGISFEIQDKSNMLLKTSFDDMRVSDASTYKDFQHAKAYYEACIKEHEKGLLKLVLLRTRLEQLLDILNEYEIDETNSDLIEKCATALAEKLQT